ncbi:hypothetical protein PUN28_019809 [Cardiocondyla obscurior]|uniref:Uncharacterized protein n=1 Tax=Cardiocondyla obscurior TaxID=286306 RepID=A0AAW2E7N2_9HYME
MFTFTTRFVKNGESTPVCDHASDDKGDDDDDNDDGARRRRVEQMDGWTDGRTYGKTDAGHSPSFDGIRARWRFRWRVSRRLDGTLASRVSHLDCPGTAKDRSTDHFSSTSSLRRRSCRPVSL